MLGLREAIQIFVAQRHFRENFVEIVAAQCGDAFGSDDVVGLLADLNQ